MKKYNLKTFDPYQESTHVVFYDSNDEIIDGLLFTGKTKNNRKIFKKYSELAKEYFSHLLPNYGMNCIDILIQKGINSPLLRR